MRKSVLAVAAILCTLAVPASAERELGRISTTFRWIGPNDHIRVERYDDPKVSAVSCYVSRAVTGGFWSWIGWTTDISRFSIACRGIGEVVIPANLPDDEEISITSTSWLFQHMRSRRMVDRQRNVLVYLVTSRAIADGSPFNSITAVPVDRREPAPTRR